jgi:hypothetical protein
MQSRGEDGLTAMEIKTLGELIRYLQELHLPDETAVGTDCVAGLVLVDVYRTYHGFWNEEKVEVLFS